MNPLKALRPIAHPFVLIGSTILFPITYDGWNGMYLSYLIKGAYYLTTYSILGFFGIGILLFYWIRSKGRAKNNIGRYILAIASFSLLMSVGTYLFGDEDQHRDDVLKNWLTLLCFVHLFHTSLMAVAYQIIPFVFKWFGEDISEDM